MGELLKWAADQRSNNRDYFNVWNRPDPMQVYRESGRMFDSELFVTSSNTPRDNQVLTITGRKKRNIDPNHRYTFNKVFFMNTNETIEQRKVNWPNTDHLSLEEGSVAAIQVAPFEVIKQADGGTQIEVQKHGANVKTAGHAVYVRLKNGQAFHVIDCAQEATAIEAAVILCKRFVVSIELPAWLIPYINPVNTIKRPTQEEMSAMANDPSEVAAIAHVHAKSVKAGIDVLLAEHESGEEEFVVTQGYKDELTDRAFSLTQIFSAVIEDHPAATGIEEAVTKARQALFDLYQIAGQHAAEHNGPITDGYAEFRNEDEPLIDEVVDLLMKGINGEIPVTLTDPNKPFVFSKDPIFYRFGDVMLGIQIEGEGPLTDNIFTNPDRGVVFAFDYKNPSHFDRLNSNSYNTSAIMDVYETSNEEVISASDRLATLISFLKSVK